MPKKTDNIVDFLEEKEKIESFLDEDFFDDDIEEILELFNQGIEQILTDYVPENDNAPFQPDLFEVWDRDDS